MNYRFKNQRGFTLIETIVYITLLAILITVIVASILTMATALSSVKSVRAVTNNALNSIERMTREIRDSGTVDSSSVLNSSPGTLMLVKTNPVTSATSSVTFLLSGNRIYVRTGNGANSPLTGSDVLVNSLVFRTITSSSSVGVKIEMTLRSASNKNVQSRNYYSTAVLRGSY